MTSAGGVPGTVNIAKWSTLGAGSWSALGSGTLGSGTTTSISRVRAIAIDSTDTNVYVGGSFAETFNNINSLVSGTTNIAKWSTITNTWSALASGIASLNPSGSTDSVGVYSIAVDSINDIVYVGGNFNYVFQNENSVLYVDSFTQFKNNTWSTIGTSLFNGFVNNISLSNNNVFIAGNFINTNSFYSRQNYAPLAINFNIVSPLGSNYVLNNDGNKLYLNSGNTPIYYDSTNNVWIYV
jgi:hypothetical protein